MGGAWPQTSQIGLLKPELSYQTVPHLVSGIQQQGLS